MIQRYPASWKKPSEQVSFRMLYTEHMIIHTKYTSHHLWRSWRLHSPTSSFKVSASVSLPTFRYWTAKISKMTIPVQAGLCLCDPGRLSIFTIIVLPIYSFLDFPDFKPLDYYVKVCPQEEDQTVETYHYGCKGQHEWNPPDLDIPLPKIKIDLTGKYITPKK